MAKETSTSMENETPDRSGKRPRSKSPNKTKSTKKITPNTGKSKPTVKKK
jgi:hypothetical protein